MKIPTVSKFFCVFDLNLGGLMLGYLGALSNATFAILLLVDLVFDGQKFKREVFTVAKEAESFSPAVELLDDLVNPTPVNEENVTTSSK